jgi:hypothetical protein
MQDGGPARHDAGGSAMERTTSGRLGSAQELRSMLEQARCSSASSPQSARELHESQGCSASALLREARAKVNAVRAREKFAGPNDSRYVNRVHAFHATNFLGRHVQMADSAASKVQISRDNRTAIELFLRGSAKLDALALFLSRPVGTTRSEAKIG